MQLNFATAYKQTTTKQSRNSLEADGKVLEDKPLEAMNKDEIAHVYKTGYRLKFVIRLLNFQTQTRISAATAQTHRGLAQTHHSQANMSDSDTNTSD